MKICMLIIATMSLAARVFAATLDEVRLGDAASEKAHAFADGNASFAENGARGEPCRRLKKPDGPARWRTEPMRFRIKVAKPGPTYLTCRLWGGDVSHDHIFVTVDGKMLGQMHLGEYDLLDYESCWPRDSERATADAEHFGVFTYRTFLLPDNLTSGKRDVEIAVYACGHVWGYGNDFEQFQKPVMNDSRGLYAFATHTESLWEGVAAKETPKPGPAPKTSVKEPDIASLRARIDRSLAKLMSPGELAKRWKDAEFLAEAYNSNGCVAYKSKDALEAIVAFVDAEAEEESKNPGFSARRDPWCCSGSAALAIGRVGASAIAPYLKDPQRRARWREYFLSGVDYLSSHRRFFANQSQIVDTYAHWCNRALKICDPKAGPPLAETRGRLAEAMGLRPMPNGYVALTKAGLSKEDGYVGSYGESTVWASANAYEASCDEEMPDGDEALLAQLRKATRARLYMRYPGVRRDGRRVARLEAQTSWRNEHFPPPPTYLTNGIDLRNAVLAKDATLIGAVRDMYDDGVVAEYAASAKDTDIAALRFLSDWPKVRRAIDKFGDKLQHMPCFGGDFEWCDPENALVVVKRGDEMLFVEAYWRARGGVNGLAKVHFVSPTAEISATVECEQRFEAKDGKFKRIGDWFQYGWMDKLYSGYRDDFGSGEKWPPHNALAGAERPVAENGARAEFYVVRFGRYTVAVNDSSKGLDYYFSSPRGKKVKVAPKSFKVIIDDELAAKAKKPVRAPLPKPPAAAAEEIVPEEAVYQWAADVEGVISKETQKPPRAYLWIPPKTRSVRAVVVGMHNMLEEPVFAHPAFRSMLAKSDVAILWFTPMVPQAWDKLEEVEIAAIEGVLGRLAEDSGHQELSSALLAPFGHSAMATFPYLFAAARPERTLCAVSIKGDWPTPGRPCWNAACEASRKRIPLMLISGEYEDGYNRRELARALMKEVDGATFSMWVDVGGGHFDWSDELCRDLGRYFAFMATASSRKTGIGEGVVSNGFWYPDARIAKMISDYESLPRGKGAFTVLGYERNGEVLKQNPKAHLQVVFGTKDMEFSVRPMFDKFVPPGRPVTWTGLEAGAANPRPADPNAEARIVLQKIQGPVEYAGGGRWLVRYNRYDPAGRRARSASFQMVYPGDDKFKRCVQQAEVDLPAPQSDFETLADRKASLSDFPLKVPTGRLAYVREGPAKVVDGRIVICDMPEHASKPISVTVCIYNENRAMRPQLQRIVIER